MATQKRNPEMVELLRPDFVHKADRAYAWAAMPGAYLGLPRLMGYWPMSLGQGSTAKNMANAPALDLVAGAAVTYGSVGLAPYVTLNGSGYLLVVGGSDSTYSPTGAFTAGGWFYATGAGLGQSLISSYKEADRGWRLVIYNATEAEFLISNNGSTFIQWRPGAPVSLGAWHFIAARYTPGAEMAIWVDGTKYTKTSGVYASIHTAAASLAVGAQADAGNFLTGRASQCFYCDAALSDIHLTALYHLTKAVFQ